MGLITKTVMMKWQNSNRDWYEYKGYIFTKMRDVFEINVENLSDGSHALVDIECDGCTEIQENVIWHHYKNQVHDNGCYYCRKCAKAGYKKYTSFFNWCYINLSKEKADEIISRWDNYKNINQKGKVLNPKNISYSSHGFNDKGYWFKCLEHPEHKSELKNINRFTNGLEGIMSCNQCNTIAITHPHLKDYFVDESKSYLYSAYSNKSAWMKCLNCGYQKEMGVVDLSRDGFSCPCCSDGVSYPNKIIFNVLEQLNLDFKPELSKTTFKWCDNYRYDFYIPILNCICEAHGLQHYKEIKGNWKMSLEEIKYNDKNKEIVAMKNNINHYIILDCRYSEMEWIKNSIMNSELPNLLGFKEEDIDWLTAHENACGSLVRKVCDLWNIGIKSTVKISNIIKLHSATISRYLKQGAKIGWCNYKLSKKVICITTGEVFNSQKEACRKYNIMPQNISRCCCYKLKSAGKLSDGTKLVWQYHDDYLKLQTIPLKLSNNQDSSF